MIVRRTIAEDIPLLREFHKKNGYAFIVPDLSDVNTIEAITMEDEDGKIMGAVFATRLAEVTLVVDPGQHPAIKLAAIRRFHSFMVLLREKGYREVIASIPPSIEKSYGKRLKSLGWLEKWTSFVTRL